jgi:hypothetical protein
MNKAAEKRSSRENDRGGAKASPIAKADARDFAALDEKIVHACFDDLKIRRSGHGSLHGSAVEFPVSLRARPLHGSPLRPVQEPELNPSRVGHPAHQAIQGVYLANQMPLAQTADGWITGHLANLVEGVRDQDSQSAHSCRCGRSLGPGVATTDNDAVEAGVSHDVES